MDFFFNRCFYVFPGGSDIFLGFFGGLFWGGRCGPLVFLRLQLVAWLKSFQLIGGESFIKNNKLSNEKRAPGCLGFLGYINIGYI